jgi:glycoprotein endo-alpha-1,2-mannosidase
MRNFLSPMVRRRTKIFEIRFLLLIVFIYLLGITNSGAESLPRQVLASYYGWWANPVTTGHWLHWQGVDLGTKHLDNSTDFPELGAYDSHDPALVARQVQLASAAGITGFVTDWWGIGDFTDQGVQLLLTAAAQRGLTVAIYYDGNDVTNRGAAAADLDYLLKQYGTNKAWLRADGKPVIFVYGRALNALPPSAWREVIAQVRHDNPGGVVLICDSFKPEYVAQFDGASTYNITDQTQHKTPAEAAAWAHVAYPEMVAGAQGKISTVTIIPGYDDSHVGRPAPRPVTDRYGGEMYRALWQEAIAARPNWILITSWNEWHEGSELEPSVQYGSTILDMTAGFARQFLSQTKADRAR